MNSLSHLTRRTSQCNATKDSLFMENEAHYFVCMIICRSFYISIFEIYSERGKGERILDLSPGGADLFMQQSSIKGLQEVDSGFCLFSL